MTRPLMGKLGDSLQDNLIAGPRFPIAHKGVTLAAGNGYVGRGTVLGIITVDGLAVAVNSSLSNGAQSPDCILAEDIDTGAIPGGDGIPAVAYSAGYFIRNSLIFGGTDTFENHETEMRKLNMHLSSSVDMDGGVR